MMWREGGGLHKGKLAAVGGGCCRWFFWRLTVHNRHSPLIPHEYNFIWVCRGREG